MDTNSVKFVRLRNGAIELNVGVVGQPSYFITGERDAVRSFIPGMDLYADPAIACTDFRGQAILPGVGHWVQQEAPDEVNRALHSFLQRL